MIFISVTTISLLVISCNKVIHPQIPTSFDLCNTNHRIRRANDFKRKRATNEIIGKMGLREQRNGRLWQQAIRSRISIYLIITFHGAATGFLDRDLQVKQKHFGHWAGYDVGKALAYFWTMAGF
jgi:hypothetical protein